MRPVSRLLSVFLALMLLGASLLTVSAHDTPVSDDDYGIEFLIDRRDTKTTVTPGTVLTFFVSVELTGGHNVPYTAILSSVAGYGPKRLGEDSSDDLTVGGRTVTSKLVEYTVQRSDLAGASRRTALIQFRLTFAPGHTGGDPHGGVIFKSNKVPVVVVKKGQTASDDTSEVDVIMDMEPPARFAEGEKVTFTLTVTTGEYWLFRSKPLRIRKQLYDADDDEIGSATTIRRAIIIRPLKTESESDLSPVTYTLTEEDAAAARVEFSYELVITDNDLRDDDGNSPNLDSDFEETFAWSESIGAAVTRTSTPTPTPTPTPAPRTIGRTSAVTVTERSRYVVHINRRDGGADFTLNIGWLTPNGARGFSQYGYIRDDDVYRGGQTYAVVRRESDNEVVRMWISPESPERFAVPWSTVNHPPYTVPVGVLSAIKLDETRPIENQLVRRFDAGGDGKIYVYRDGAWRHIPDLATFKAEGFYWCDVTAADVGFFGRALIGSPLPASGGADDPNYPSCHSK